MSEDQFDYAAHAAWCRKAREMAKKTLANANPKDAKLLTKIIENMDSMILRCEEAAGNA